VTASTRSDQGPPDPVFLATAVEIVLQAGAIQLARRASGFHVDKKGTIDLVTEVDLECELMCRAILAERFLSEPPGAEEGINTADRYQLTVHAPAGALIEYGDLDADDPPQIENGPVLAVDLSVGLPATARSFAFSRAATANRSISAARPG